MRVIDTKKKLSIQGTDLKRIQTRGEEVLLGARGDGEGRRRGVWEQSREFDESLW